MKNAMMILGLLMMAMMSFGCSRITSVHTEQAASSRVNALDDQADPMVYVQSYSGIQGQPANFLVILSKPPRGVVRIQLQTEDRTAKAGTDYDAYSAELTLMPGEMTAMISVPTYIAPPEVGTTEFVFKATSATGAVIVKSQGYATLNPPGIL